MLNILKYRIKAIMTNKIYISIFLAISISLGMISLFIETNSTDKQVFNISIIDEDETKLSKDLIESITKNLRININIDTNIDKSMVKLIKGKYDAIYQIKEGYEKNLIDKNIKDLIVVHKNVEAVNIDWLSDQIAIMSLKEWIYYDMFDRISLVDDRYTMEKFKEDYSESLESEKIFFLNKINIRKDNNDVDVKDIPLFFNQIWGYAILVFLIVYGKSLIVDLKSGIIDRYEFSGISRTKYYVLDMIIKLVTLFIPYLLSILIVSFALKLGIIVIIRHLLYTLIYIMVSWCIVMLIGRLFKDFKGYAFSCQVFILLSVFYGLVKPTGGVIAIVGKLLPITWYFNL